MDPPTPSQSGFNFPSPSLLQYSLFHDPHAADPTGIIDWNAVLSGQLGTSTFGPTGIGDINGQKLPALGMDPTISTYQREEDQKQMMVDDDDDQKNKLLGKGGKTCGSSRGARKATRPRFAFQTRSPNDILDDGYRWRKYGQKAVKNSSYPRSYYRCTHHTCNVKKQVQRLSKDTSIVVTTYEGIHNHPCEKVMETLTPLLKQMQFLTRF